MSRMDGKKTQKTHTHCRESVGTGPVVLKVVRVTGAVFASSWTKCDCAPLFSHTHYWYTVSIFKLSGVYKNISTAVVLYCLVEPFFSPDLIVCTTVVYTCKKFSTWYSIKQYLKPVCFLQKNGNVVHSESQN